MESPAAVLVVGRVRRPHGIHGEIIVEIDTDFPDRMEAGVRIGLGNDAPDRWVTVHRVRVHKGAWLVSFEGMVTREDVEPLRDLSVFLPEQRRDELPENYYYEHELEGLRCVAVGGENLGTVARLERMGGLAMLIVTSPRGEVLVPFRSPIVVTVEVGSGTIVLDPPGGLFDDDAL